MKEFPSNLKPSNKESFNKLYEERLLCYLRRDIYENILLNDERKYFELDKFNEKVNNIELVKSLVNRLIIELELLGWKCKYGYGETGLFIYSDKVPDNCW